MRIYRQGEDLNQTNAGLPEICFNKQNVGNKEMF